MTDTNAKHLEEAHATPRPSKPSKIGHALRIAWMKTTRFFKKINDRLHGRWTDEDLWDYGDSLLRAMSNGLYRFAENCNGTPMGYEDKKRWLKKRPADWEDLTFVTRNKQWQRAEDARQPGPDGSIHVRTVKEIGDPAWCAWLEDLEYAAEVIKTKADSKNIETTLYPVASTRSMNILNADINKEFRRVMAWVAVNIDDLWW